MKSKQPKIKIEPETALCFAILIGLVVGVYCLIHATTLYYVGLHGLDLAQNMERMNLMYDIDVVDIDSSFQELTFTDVYIRGVNQQRESIYFFIVGAFFIGVVFMGIAYIHDMKSRKLDMFKREIDLLERENELIGGQR